MAIMFHSDFGCEKENSYYLFLLIRVLLLFLPKQLLQMIIRLHLKFNSQTMLLTDDFGFLPCHVSLVLTV